jgi:hypothetical protein
MKEALDKINYKDFYNKLLKSGMFWEMFPELVGIWEKDKVKFKRIGITRKVNKRK